MQTTDLDITIFGAGIAGLWTLARLSQAGYRVALFEKHAIGGVQSIASQGIIHGGTKYALTGKLTGSAMSIGEMPAIWRAALDGHGEIDLSDVRILSGNQFLWTTGSVAAGVAGFFAGKVMQSRMQSLPRSGFPPPFDAPDFRGTLYRLDEPVLDTRSLMQSLANRLGQYCYLVTEPMRFQREADGWQLTLPDGQRLRSHGLIFTAGCGNAELLSAVGHGSPRMQTRPLHMLMLRGALPMLQAHCLGASANPRLTVTSYPLDDGQVAWYLGGQVAEEGIARSAHAQIDAGRAELSALLPWMDFSAVQWATLPIERAEIATPGNRRPDDAYVAGEDRVITCWPTKLAFAPRVARLVEQALRDERIAPSLGESPQLDLARPPLARQPWEETHKWI